MSAAIGDDVYALGEHSLQLLPDARVFIVDSRYIRLSPTEFRIIQQLHHGRPVSDRELAVTLFQTEHDFWVRDTLDKHVDNIRRKLKKERLPVQIHRLLSYGYILLPHEQKAAS